jgi:phage terminase large subunit-like protein
MVSILKSSPALACLALPRGRVARILAFLRSLELPEGPRAGRKMRVAPFQRDFIKGAFRPKCHTAVLSVARGSGKSCLSAGLASAECLGVISDQPRRLVIVASRTRDQSRIIWSFAEGLARSLPEELQKQLVFRRWPVLEIEFTGNGGGMIKAIASDAKNSLGSSPTLAICDEFGHWEREPGEALESALRTGLGKRSGRMIIISTSAPTDDAPLSQWLDHPKPGVFCADYRPPPGLPCDDLESLLMANPGSKFGVGPSPDWLLTEARLAVQRGGMALANCRLYLRNERVSVDGRSMLLDANAWGACEVSELPPRNGICVVGIDLGSSNSMSAAAFYWPQSFRLEVFATFPSKPSLADRGAADGVGSRYSEMHSKG